MPIIVTHSLALEIATSDQSAEHSKNSASTDRRARFASAAMASHHQARKQTTKGREEEAGQAHGHGARGQQGQAMNLEEMGKHRAEAQQRSVDAICAAEERFSKANQEGRAHGTVAVTQAPGATVISFHQEGTKQPAKQQEESHAGTEAQQWLEDASSDDRERCNRAMGMGTSPTAAHGGSKGAAAPSYAGATAASRGHQKTKKSSTEQEGGQARGQLTRQVETGHGRDAHKISDAEAAVEKHGKGKQAGATAGQHQSANDTASWELGATDAVDAKNAGVRGAAGKTQEATGTATDYAKQTAATEKDVTGGAAGTTVDYAKQAAAKTKDTTLAASGTTAEYAKQAAVKAKDATVSTGGTAAEYAKAAAEKAKEAAVATARTTAGYTQQAVVKTKDVTVAAGAQVAQKATELRADTAHRVAEYAGEKAEQGKEATARAEESGPYDATAKAKDSAAHTAVKASDVVTGRRQHEDTLSGDVARRAGGTSEQAKDTVKDAMGSVAQMASDATGRVKDAAGHKAGEAKHRASSETGGMTGGGATASAKGGTTIVGDVLEAVGATVVGLAQHTKGIVVGEEELVPKDVVRGGEAKVAGAKEEKRKNA